ncbi:MAG: thioredoxin domain-containing protein [Thermomicrobiales bacterium]|nr:thioredoxin domain-containing protein [Thermomicrobiales bacterium]
MINRRTFLAATSLGTTGLLAGRHLVSAQTPESTTAIPFQNASFIRTDLTATPVPVVGTPTYDVDPVELTGYMLGSAEHTLTLFSDYRCPHCRLFHHEVEPQLLADYIATGKLQLELIDMTVVGVPSFAELTDDSLESVQAAEAAAAAAEQGKFLEYREWLFTGPDVLSVGDFVDENLVQGAVETGLDEEQFATTLADGIYEQDIVRSVTLALQLGVPGTPTFTLDRTNPFQIADGDYDGLKAILDDFLGE